MVRDGVRVCKWEKLEVKFDADMWELVQSIGWSVSKGHKTYLYVKCTGPQFKNKILARVLTDCPDHLQVDHINGDPLDNRMENLRLVTPQQNQMNKAKFAGKAGDLPKGVLKVGKRYRAYIRIDYATRHIGVFDTSEEAYSAYKVEAEKLFGEFAHHVSRQSD